MIFSKLNGELFILQKSQFALQKRQNDPFQQIKFLFADKLFFCFSREFEKLQFKSDFKILNFKRTKTSDSNEPGLNNDAITFETKLVLRI